MAVQDSSDIGVIVGRLARSLDADNFPAVRAMLADECVYVIRDQTLTGPEAVTRSYADAAAGARRDFDDVRYESEIVEIADRSATVLFTDYLGVAGGRWHRHRCRQHFTVGADGRVVRIVHEDLPGEREALAEFLRACGIRR